ncbi:MAG: ribosomal protein S18-alanine N-acetyltransferase [Clostridia bacterium]|nr:ribosomal protein S18-alanine N-acetyltransferase [Clostridia bacterium]
MAEITIRQATYDDIPSLCALEIECFSSPWSAKSFEDFFKNGCSHCLAAVYEGEVCGYVGMNLILGEGEITNLAVFRKYRRLGAASELLAQLYKTEGLERLLLDVRESNTAARALYEKCGFTVDGVRKGFYTKPREDAVLMSRKITQKDR